MSIIVHKREVMSLTHTALGFSISHMSGHTGQLCRNPTSGKHSSKMLCESPRNPNFQGPVVTYYNEVYFFITIFFEIVSCLQNMRWDS